MNTSTTSRLVLNRQHLSAPLRLDLLANPYMPSPATTTAVEMFGRNNSFDADLDDALKQRLAFRHNVSPESIVLADGVDAFVRNLARYAGGWNGTELISALDRDPSLTSLAASSEASSLVYLRSPSELDGTSLGSPGIGELAQDTDLLIVDERHGGYATRQLSSISREFDNIVVVRTFEYWAGLETTPVSYAITSRTIADNLRELRGQQALPRVNLLAALSTLDDIEYCFEAIAIVRKERLRLYRMLRKLNTMRPERSETNFVLARLERGERSHLRAFLDAAGVTAHYPPHPSLSETIRFSARSQASTNRLKAALLDWSKELG